MPYVIDRFEGVAAKTAAAKSYSFADPDMEEFVDKIEKLELIGSCFSDPGPDFCEWVAYNRRGEVVRRRRIQGY
jgi:hypothetical protein